MAQVVFYFHELVSVDGETSQVKQFGTFMNCCQEDLCQYVSSITQVSVGLQFFSHYNNFKCFSQ